MSLPKKGSRKITIDDVSYRYIVSGNDEHIDLVIELDNKAGQRLIVSFKYHSQRIEKNTESRETKTYLTQTNQITPGVVRQAMQYGIKNGWTPNKKGTEIRMNDIDDKVKLSLRTSF